MLIQEVFYSNLNEVYNGSIIRVRMTSKLNVAPNRNCAFRFIFRDGNLSKILDESVINVHVVHFLGKATIKVLFQPPPNIAVEFNFTCNLYVCRTYVFLGSTLSARKRWWVHRGLECSIFHTFIHACLLDIEFHLRKPISEILC